MTCKKNIDCNMELFRYTIALMEMRHVRLKVQLFHCRSDLYNIYKMYEFYIVYIEEEQTTQLPKDKVQNY